MKNWDITILQLALLAVGILILALGILKPNVVSGVWHLKIQFSPADLLFVFAFEVVFVFIALGLEMLRKKEK